ncbi:hypothetical protein PHYPSEUDO_011854 [Phytophthora pseudosyringae]|uniref:Ubiquitin-like protease family profile domain-containing protein n=1 Tax=Phytophthora pseudosyringae TaxID=221518 RepID=A0A8T1VCS4_9STRA|nr:hypothetical protein PHYPSEUDO_011854 [Phytophthora pseudosyringae]
MVRGILARPCQPRAAAVTDLLCTLLQQETQESQDTRRFQDRVRDSVLYSHELNVDYPVDVIKPPLSSHTSRSVREEVSDPERISYDKYRRWLQGCSEEYGPSPSKKQKVPIEKVNHTHEQRKTDRAISRKLHNTLRGGKNPLHVGGGVGLGMLGKREEHMHSVFAKEVKQVQAASDTEAKEETEHTQPSNDDIKDATPVPIMNSSSKDVTSFTARSREEEIAELEEELRAHHLSRTSDADRLFYYRLAKREANTILEEVLLEDIYDIAEDVFDEEEEKSRNKELPPELLEIVEDALHEGPMEEVLIQKYNVDITRRHLQCLLPMTWLNDEVINFYFQMMSDRDEALVNAGVLPKRSHFFNSFFHTKVSENGYNFVNVRRWTRKIDLFAMDKIFMPVNVGNMHWCMAVIYMAEKRIQYYDSMHGSGAACLKVLLRYLHDESEHKKKQKFNDEGWELVATTPETPQQNNGSDCGVFSCMFADYLALNKPLSFKQKDIPFHRHRMVLHMSRGYIPLEEEGL